MSAEKFRLKVERLIRRACSPVVFLLVRFHISPNVVSITGFLVTIIGVGLFVIGAPVVAGLIFLFGSLLDLLDGEVARTSNRVTPFGAVVDSLLDRMSEGMLLIAIAWYFVDRGEVVGVIITMAGMLSSVCTSYVRARAEAAGATCTVGWITRPERVIILTLGMISDYLFFAIVVLFVSTTLTVIQRTIHVYLVLRERQMSSVDETDSGC